MVRSLLFISREMDFVNTFLLNDCEILGFCQKVHIILIIEWIDMAFTMCYNLVTLLNGSRFTYD